MKISNITPLTNLQDVKGGTCGTSYGYSYSSSYSYSSCASPVGSYPSGSYPSYGCAPTPPRPPAHPTAPTAPTAPCAPRPVSFCMPKISFGCGW